MIYIYIWSCMLYWVLLITVTTAVTIFDDKVWKTVWKMQVLTQLKQNILGKPNIAELCSPLHVIKSSDMKEYDEVDSAIIKLTWVNIFDKINNRFHQKVSIDPFLRFSSFDQHRNNRRQSIFNVRFSICASEKPLGITVKRLKSRKSSLPVDTHERERISTLWARSSDIDNLWVLVCDSNRGVNGAMNEGT